MFWTFATTSNMDTLLEKEDVTLKELMDDDDVLQECKGQNTKLIEFLSKADVMEELVSLIISEPSSEIEDNVKYKYPNIACELLTSDVTQMNEILGETEAIRQKLFSFLDNDTPLNPLLASFFSKVVGILLSRKPEPTLEFIKGKSDFLGCVLKHLGTSAIMDLLLRLVTCVEAVELRAQVLSWLNENHLVERLIGLIDPSVDETFHCNSAQSLCDIIRLSREHMYTMQEAAQDDPLLNTLEKKETVQLLLKHMFDNETCESVIVNGISVLLALLEIRRPAPFGFPEMAPELTQLDVERLASGVSKTLHGLSDRLSDFHNLLQKPPKREAMQCTFGELSPPLGNTRLHVGKLLSAILITNTHNINVQLSELQIFNALLDLFFQYEYNNFLHTQTVQCIQTVLSNVVTVTSNQSPAPAYNEVQSASNNPDNEENENRKEEDDLENPRKVAPLLTHLFEDCRLIQRILDAWEDNRVHETEAGGHRKGNMGHLTLITNYILENMEKSANSERIRHFIEGMPEEDQGRWQKFVAEPLAEMNEKNSRELGGHNPMHFSSDDDGETDYRDIPFTSGSSQQAFTDYQLQQMTSNFIDQFGFTEGDFAEQEEPDKFNKINSIDFDIKADTNTPRQELFEEVCQARLPSFGDSSDEEEENKEKEAIDANEEGDEDWEQQASNTQDSPFKYDYSNPTVSLRERSSSGGSVESSGSEEEEAPSPTTTITSIKLPTSNEDMDTTQPQEWAASFESSSGGEAESKEAGTDQQSSPKDENLDSSSAAPSANTETGWANFDNFDQLNRMKSSDLFSSSEEQAFPPRAADYIAPDSTGQESSSTSDKMEVAMETPPPASELASEEDAFASSEAEVKMDVQENTKSSQEEDPNIPESSTSENSDSDVKKEEASSSSSSSETQMETDECSSTSEDNDAESSDSLENRLHGEQKDASIQVSSTTNTNTQASDPTPSDPPATTTTTTSSPSSATQDDPSSDVITSQQEAGNPHTPEPDSSSSPQNPLKQTDVQNDEVTSSTTDVEVKMNGPV